MPTVGVDLGGTNIYTVVLGDGDDRERLGTSKMRTPLSGDRLAVVDVLEAAVLSAIDDAGIDLADIDAMGVGTPGVVIGGTVGGASNVPGWSERFGLAEMLTSRLVPSVRVVNDVTAAAVGEHREGAGRGHDDLLVIFVGTGVGSGLIIGGRPYEGVNGGAGEFGHTVVALDGAQCPCGRFGCVEAYAGRRAMEQAARKAVDGGRKTLLFELMESLGKRQLTSGVFQAAVEAGDELAIELLGSGANAVGAGIASAINLLDVEAVVIGGGLADKLGGWFQIRLEAAMRPHLFLEPPTVKIMPAALGDQSGALGAALLAREIA